MGPGTKGHTFIAPPVTLPPPVFSHPPTWTLTPTLHKGGVQTLFLGKFLDKLTHRGQSHPHIPPKHPYFYTFTSTVPSLVSTNVLSV